MTSGTVEAIIETRDVSIEVVRLNVNDEQTYASRKFNTIQAADVTSNTDTDAHINVTYSGTTATINYNGVSKSDCTLVLWGE